MEEENTGQDNGMFACLGNVPREQLGNTGSKKRVEQAVEEKYRIYIFFFKYAF